jgi:hypothetical protein
MYIDTLMQKQVIVTHPVDLQATFPIGSIFTSVSLETG